MTPFFYALHGAIMSKASFLFHMTREFDEVLRWTLDLRRITGNY